MYIYIYVHESLISKFTHLIQVRGNISFCDRERNDSINKHIYDYDLQSMIRYQIHRGVVL